MKTTTAIRIKEAMDHSGLRQVDVLKRAEPYCEKFGVKLGRNDLSQYVSGKVSPGQEKLTVLALALRVSETWLMGYDVPMEPNAYEDSNIIRFDAELHDALEIIESAGYAWAHSQSPDSDIIIKDKLNHIVACLHDYELVSRYESLQRKGAVTAESLLIDSKQAFLTYLDSLGYHLYRDDPEHKPFMSTNELTCGLDYDTLDILKLHIDNYAKATVDSKLLALKEKEIRQERLEKERTLRHLRGENIYKETRFEKDWNDAHIAADAAHSRTDITPDERTEELKQQEDDIMNDDNF